MTQKGNRISQELLSSLSEFVTARLGLYFAKERWRDLERGVASAAGELGFEDVEACVRWLLSSTVTKRHIEILASRLTVGETYFFRDKHVFEILEQRVFRELIDSRKGKERSLRIWSAGCASGEEPYSVAILLERMIPDIREWNITILATDINPHFLRKASKGEYTEWSFREVPSWIRERYFTKTKGGRYELLARLRKMATFSPHNLREDFYPSLTNNTNAMDVIFCRNVLMYFSREVQRKVVGNLHRCLVEGGYLIVSPSELSGSLFSDFAAVNEPGGILYRKEGRGISVKEGRICEDAALEDISEKIEIPFVETAAGLAPHPPAEAETVADIKEPGPDIYAKASALYGRGRYAEAIEEMLASPSISEADAKVMELLARAYANQGKLNDALSWCEKAAAAAKLDPGSHYLLAVVLQEQGRTEEASASFKRALYLDPDFVLAHFALGNLTRRQGKLKESARHFKNAMELLQKQHKNDVLTETEGMTVGRLMEIIKSTAFAEAAA